MYVYLTKRQVFLCKFLGLHSSVNEGPHVLGCDNTLLMNSLTLKKSNALPSLSSIKRTKTILLYVHQALITTDNFVAPTMKNYQDLSPYNDYVEPK